MDNHVIIQVVSMAQNLFFDYSDTEEEDNTILEKVDNYVEETVPNMTSRQFKMHFRMNPNTFENFLQTMHSYHERYAERLHQRGRPSISLEKEIMILIWYLGNMESFRSVADRFGVSKSTCWSALYRTCDLLLKVNSQFKIIAWPSIEKADTIIRNFERRYHMPGVLGAIDGSHIRIVAPKEFHNSYINRKSYHSVLLQGVCDDQLLFTDVYAGEAGSIHDLTLFKRSDLYQRICNNEIIFPNDSHLIGDLAYVLSDKVMVGFKNYGNLSARQKNFNLILSKARAVIENAFGLLKGRFRRLKFMETTRLDLIPKMIVSACILHNICILNEDFLENNVDIEAEIEGEARMNPHNNIDINDEVARRNATIKRNNIVNSLPLL